MILNRGAIHRVKLSPTAGREQQGIARPCLIAQTQSLQNCGTAIVIPLTSQKPSVVDESRIQAELLGKLSEEELEPIKQALKLVLNL